MSRPLLSICIPTYNRAQCLSQCLTTIVDQFTDINSYQKVEIVISNNGSIDNTENVIRTFQEKFTNIIYVANQGNTGFDRNLLQVVEKSTGIYCLTLGDDDGLFPESIPKILAILEREEAPYYMLNSWGYDHELQNPIMFAASRPIKDNSLFPSLIDFVKSIKGYNNLVGTFGGMSVQLFKRDMWINFDEKNKYLDTQAIHLFILLSVYKNYPFMLIAEPFIKTRNDNMRWDICPGFETASKRVNETVRIALWISDLYDLSLSPTGVKILSLWQVYVLSFKGYVKKILYKIGLRRQ